MGTYRLCELRLWGPYWAHKGRDFHTNFWVLGHSQLEELDRE